MVVFGSGSLGCREDDNTNQFWVFYGLGNRNSISDITMVRLWLGCLGSRKVTMTTIHDVLCFVVWESKRDIFHPIVVLGLDFSKIDPEKSYGAGGLGFKKKEKVR